VKLEGLPNIARAVRRVGRTGGNPAMAAGRVHLSYGRARSLPNLLAPACSFDRCHFQPLGIAFAANRSIEKRSRYFRSGERYFRSGERFLGGRRFSHLSVEQILHGCGLNGPENLYSRGVELCGHDANPIDTIIMHFTPLQRINIRQSSMRTLWPVGGSASAEKTTARLTFDAPRTPEGLERSRRFNWKHGYYSGEAKQVRRDARQQYRLLRQLIAAGNEDDILGLISSM
jgi:hypothetical protein